MIEEVPENQHKGPADSLQVTPQAPLPSTESLEKAEATAATKPKSLSKRPSLRRLNSELKQALDSWETLSEEMEHKLSPEEEQLREVKRLLGELKDKLKQFSE